MKRGKHPTTKRRNHKQSVKERYSKAREDAQLTGLIPIEPVGAVRDERVDPLSQDAPTDHLGLAAVAARNNWATPDAIKPKVVDNLSRIASGDGTETVIDGDGRAISTGPSLKTQVYAAKVLTEIDQIQWERDHPKEAGEAKGATNVNVGVAVNNQPIADIGELILKARKQMNAGRESNDGAQNILDDNARILH